MARRKKRQSSPFEGLVELLFILIGILLQLLIRIISFVYDLLTVYLSGYKSKSGNSFFKTYFNKGNYGEFVLYRKVVRVLGKKSVLTNLYLDNKNTEKTEIDVIAVTEKGIYVFEMKNYSGYIYGSEKDKNWTQVLNKWTKNKFFNPLRQNYAHTKAVENYLKVPEEMIVPIIVFSNNSKLSKINVSQDKNVFQYSDAIRFVKKNEKNAQSVLDTSKKEKFLIELLECCNMSDEVKQKHIEEVQELL